MTVDLAFLDGIKWAIGPIDKWGVPLTGEMIKAVFPELSDREVDHVLEECCAQN